MRGLRPLLRPFSRPSGMRQGVRFVVRLLQEGGEPLQAVLGCHGCAPPCRGEEAENEARSVSGVVRVINNLQVKAPPSR